LTLERLGQYTSFNGMFKTKGFFIRRVFWLPKSGVDYGFCFSLRNRRYRSD